MTAPAALRVIGRLDPPAFDPAHFPGFSEAQVIAGLTVPAVLLTEAEIAEAARVCPVFRGPHMLGSAS
jgi:hypothetical protein